MNISRETLDEIRARTDLVALAGTRMALKRAGGLFKGCCPFHQEKTPSFVVYPNDQTFHCFGCQAHGSAIDFLMRLEGLTFLDAVRQLARQAGIVLETETDGAAGLRRSLIAMHESLAAFYRRCLLQTAEAGPAREYLASRELDEAVGERFLIGYAPRRAGALATWAKRNEWPLKLLLQAGLLVESTSPQRRSNTAGPSVYDRFRGRLMFPIRDPQGRIVAFSGRLIDSRARSAKYVNSPETPIFHKGRILYGMDRARQAIVRLPHREALVCEGQIDVVRCHAMGFEYAVAPQGTAFTPEHAQLLSRYADSAVLVFDADDAGRKAALRTAGHLMAAGMPVRIAELPAGEDPDSFLRRHAPEAFRNRLDLAESVVPFQIRFLQATESQPEAVDAIERVALAVVETVAQASSAIQRARLIQEAGAALNLPEAALAETLEARLAAVQRRRSIRPSSAGPSKSPLPPQARARPATGSGPSIASAGQAEAPPPPPTDEDGADGHASPDAPVAPCPEETALCELVCQHADDPAVVQVIEDYLPLVFVPHPACRRILQAAVETRHAGKDKLLELQETGEADACRWIDRFATADHRIAGARDTTPEAAAHDCILGLWRRQLQRERQQLNADADRSAGTAGRFSERWALTTLINRLSRGGWTLAQPLLMAELHRRRKAGRLVQP